MATKPENNSSKEPELTVNDLTNLHESIKSKKITVEVTPPRDDRSNDQLSPEDTIRVVNLYASNLKVNYTSALVGITKLVQDGGTNLGKQKLVREINGVKYDLTELRSVVTLVNKTGTVRKLARSLRDTIATIALANKWPGPLTKELQRLDLNLIISEPDSIYCSEIHTDNYSESMPAKIREALKLRELKIRTEIRSNNQKAFKKTAKMKAARKKK